MLIHIYNYSGHNPLLNTLTNGHLVVKHKPTSKTTPTQASRLKVELKSNQHQLQL